MTDKEKKNKIVDILFDFYDEYRSNEINRPMIPSIYAGKIIDSMQEEPVSEELEEACEQLAENARKHKAETSSPFFSQTDYRQGVIDGAKWQKEHLWKPADGDDLPEYEREVVAFQEIFPTDVDVPSLLKIAIAHRPKPEGYDGKSLTTGEVEHYTPKTYDKGSWNIPDVKWWLDCSLPNMEED